MTSTLLHPALPADIAKPLERRWTDQEAFAYCTELTKSHYENFPVGSMLMPASIQPAVHSLYAFMRTADDFSDENRAAGDEAERMAYLNTWDDMLAACERGETKHPVFVALRVTLDKYQLPVQWLRDLLTAFKMDVTIRRYKTYDDVLNYCRYSANPVGRLILTLWGYRQEELYTLSDSICTGLQLANHWQDVDVDMKKDRIYLPQDDMKSFGVTEDDLRAAQCTPAFQKLLMHEVGRARRLFDLGKPLPGRVQGRLRLELRLTWSGGVTILDKIEAVHCDVFHHRPTVGKGDWAKLFLKTVFTR